jgi:hypothetical protein
MLCRRKPVHNGSRPFALLASALESTASASANRPVDTWFKTVRLNSMQAPPGADGLAFWVAAQMTPKASHMCNVNPMIRIRFTSCCIAGLPGRRD